MKPCGIDISNTQLRLDSALGASRRQRADHLRALGTIVKTYPGMEPATHVCCGLLDYYDHWSEIDPRLAAHHNHLSRAADIFGHDLVNIATYVSEILGWLPAERIRLSPSVVCVGGMTEAFLVSIRSAYDALAIALAYVASEKPGQAPAKSLRGLITWAKRNESRVRPRVLKLLAQEHGAFLNVRTLRDYVVHSGAHATIHCDGHQFNLWIHSSNGWVTREPLLPFLARHLKHLLAFADAASLIINEVIELPKDRLRSRAVEGVLIGSLHQLQAVESDYAAASP